MKVALIKTMTKFLNLIRYQLARVQYVSVIYARCNRTAGLKMDSYFSPGYFHASQSTKTNGCCFYLPKRLNSTVTFLRFRCSFD